MGIVISKISDIEKYNPYRDLLEFRSDEYFEDKFLEYLNEFKGEIEKLKEELGHKKDKEIDRLFKKVIKKRNDEEIDRIIQDYYFKKNMVNVSNEDKIISFKKRIRIVKDIVLASEEANMRRLLKVDRLVGDMIDNVSLSCRLDATRKFDGLTIDELMGSFEISSDFSPLEYEKFVLHYRNSISEICDYYRNNYSVDRASRCIRELNSKFDKKLDYFANELGCFDKEKELIDDLVKKYDDMEVSFSNYDEFLDLFRKDIGELKSRFKTSYSLKMANKLIKILDVRTGEVLDRRANSVGYPYEHEKRLQEIFDSYQPGELDIFDRIFYNSDEEVKAVYDKYQKMTGSLKKVFEMRIYEEYVRIFKGKIRDFNRDIRRVYSSRNVDRMVNSVNKRADKLICENAKMIGKPVARNPWIIRKYLWSDTDNFASKKGVAVRKFISPFMRNMVRVAMDNKLIIEERGKLDSTKQYIFLPTHYFTEDVIGMFSSLGRHAYMLMGTTDQIENNILMMAAAIMGFFYVDRNDLFSRKSCVDKQNRLIDYGTNFINYVGGSWENSENELQPLSFSGPYRTSVAKNVQIVPVGLYLVREEKKIYVRYGEPLDLSKCDEVTANEIIRETLASMHFKQMSKHSIPIDTIEIDGYGKTHNLPYDQRTYYMNQVGMEYWNQYWSKPFAKEEIGLRPAKVTTEEEVYEFIDRLSREKLIELSSILADPGLRREEKSRYDIIDYIDRNYDFFKQNRGKIKVKKK